MAAQWMLAIHGCLTLLSVVAFLCGQWPIFQGTFVQRLNYFFTGGAYDFLLRAAVVIFGTKGKHVFLSIEQYCCERPNPILQMLYLTTIGVTYYFVLKSCFGYIPGYYVSEIHWYTGVMAVLVGIILFLVTSLSDPGIINSENVSRYLSAYSYDGTIYTEKQCATCNIPRPARSKHCSICDRCVARFDHHCGWMNNCIGEKNLRYFLAFLLWHFLLCLYGLAVLAAILAGELNERQVLRILTGGHHLHILINLIIYVPVYYGIGNSFRRLFPHVVQWLLNFYNTQVLLITFLAVISLLLAGFFSYHVHLVITNTTTNETYKWDNYKRWQLSLIQVKAATESLKQSAEIASTDHQMNRGADTSDMKCRLFSYLLNFKELYAQWQNNRHCFVKNNYYDKGVLHNIHEVLCPVSCRECFSSRKGD